MRIRQYVYFSLLSTQVSAAEITTRLGVEPDRVRVRGTRSTRLPLPVYHAWQVICDDPRLRVDEQVARVVHRLSPHNAEIVALARELTAADPQHGGAVMRVVRYCRSYRGSTSCSAGHSFAKCWSSYWPSKPPSTSMNTDDQRHSRFPDHPAHPNFAAATTSANPHPPVRMPLASLPARGDISADVDLACG